MKILTFISITTSFFLLFIQISPAKDEAFTPVQNEKSLLNGEFPRAFAGAPEGASTDSIKKDFSHREGVRLTNDSSRSLIYIGGTFSAIPVERWEFDFSDDTLFQASACLAIPSGDAIDGTPLRNLQFEDICNLLNSKYGEGKRESKEDGTIQVWNFAENKEGKSCKITLKYNWGSPQQFYIQYTWKSQNRTPIDKDIQSNDI